MSTFKRNLQLFQNITSGDMSTSTITSTVSNILNMDNIGIEFTWSGTSPVGTCSVEVSSNYNQDLNGNVTNAGTWIPLLLLPTPSVSGNSGSIYIDLNQVSAPWIRTKYTKVSGTGTLQGYISGKTV